jgi:hypothetical protein
MLNELRNKYKSIEYGGSPHKIKMDDNNGMNFVDSIEDLKLHVWSNCFKITKTIKACNELIASHMEMVSAIRLNIESSEKQIKVWQDLMVQDLSTDYKEEIEVFQLIVDFYRVNGRLILLELDVNTAFKYIFKAKTEYEFRFFARRIYTLMYEANKGLVIPAGQLYKKLIGKVDVGSLELYKKEHSKLNKFLIDHQEELKEIRNSNEAHKFRDFEEQLESIEKLSVVRSIELIQEFNVYLANLTMAFMIVPGTLSKSLGEILKKKMKGK